MIVSFSTNKIKQNNTYILLKFFLISNGVPSFCAKFGYLIAASLRQATFLNSNTIGYTKKLEWKCFVYANFLFKNKQLNREQLH